MHLQGIYNECENPAIFAFYAIYDFIDTLMHLEGTCNESSGVGVRGKRSDKL